MEDRSSGADRRRRVLSGRRARGSSGGLGGHRERPATGPIAAGGGAARGGPSGRPRTFGAGQPAPRRAGPARRELSSGDGGLAARPVCPVPHRARAARAGAPSSGGGDRENAGAGRAVAVAGALAALRGEQSTPGPSPTRAEARLRRWSAGPDGRPRRSLPGALGEQARGPAGASRTGRDPGRRGG